MARSNPPTRTKNDRPPRHFPKLTWDERAERRRAIAAAILADPTYRAVERCCQKYGVSTSQIRISCHQHGVPMPLPHGSRLTTNPSRPSKKASAKRGGAS